jgi:hypothetical protein
MKIPQEETSSGVSNEADSAIVTVLLVAANVAVVAIVVGKCITYILLLLTTMKYIIGNTSISFWYQYLYLLK